MVTQSLISRTNVIDGAELDEFHVGTVNHCGGHVLTMTTVFSRAEVHGLNRPKRILADPTDGRRFVVVGVYWSKEAGAYTGGGTVNVDHRDPSTTTIAGIAVGSIRQTAASSGWAHRAGQSGLPADYPTYPGGVQLATNQRFQGDGGALTVTVRYIEIEE